MGARALAAVLLLGVCAAQPYYESATGTDQIKAGALVRDGAPPAPRLDLMVHPVVSEVSFQQDNGWFWCARENGTCSFSGNVIIRYGMVAPDAASSQDPNKGVFAYMRPRPQDGLSGSVECIGDNFPLNAALDMVAKNCWWHKIVQDDVAPKSIDEIDIEAFNRRPASSFRKQALLSRLGIDNLLLSLLIMVFVSMFFQELLILKCKQEEFIHPEICQDRQILWSTKAKSSYHAWESSVSEQSANSGQGKDTEANDPSELLFASMETRDEEQAQTDEKEDNE